MENEDTTKIVSSIAKAYLKQVGFLQKSKSRIWIHDHAWWLTIVEFQPNKWGKGCFLNVGVCWLWNKQDYLSYDFVLQNSSRVTDFVEFDDETEFSEQIEQMCKDAMKQDEKFKNMFYDFNSASKYLIGLDDSNIWNIYHKVIISYLTNDKENAHKYSEKILKYNIEFDWQKLILDDILKLRTLLDNHGESIIYIENNIRETRKLLKLEELDIILATI